MTPHTNTRTPRPRGWRRVLSLRHELVDFGVRGFRRSPASTREMLETAGRAFLDGYNAELATVPGVPADLTGTSEPVRGFAAEGAAMAAVLLDSLNPRGGRRFETLLRAHRDRYVYLIHVGAGWARAKLPVPHRRYPDGADPLVRWLAEDGWGFCRAFFAAEPALTRWNEHRHGCGPTCAIRYQGLGRHLWFRECGDGDAIVTRVGRLPVQHRGDAWSGIGLAVTYAGGGATATLTALRDAAGAHRRSLAQGAAFGAEAWRRAGPPPERVHSTVRLLAGVSVEQAADWTARARQGLDRPGATAGDYGLWRTRVQSLAAQALPT